MMVNVHMRDEHSANLLQNFVHVFSIMVAHLSVRSLTAVHQQRHITTSAVNNKKSTHTMEMTQKIFNINSCNGNMSY